MNVLVDTLSNKELAPIVLFTYNRLLHTMKTIEALAKNELAQESDLIIFSDGYKQEKDKKQVCNVREYLKSIKEKSIFKSVTIVYNKENKGLANSIIEGVTDVLNKYSKVIVVEDDVVTTEDFLRFMNDALEFYADNKGVWSIGSYTHPMNLGLYDKDVFAVQRCSSYCWGTWIDRWRTIDWGIKDYKKFKYNFVERYKFNRSGNDMAAMLDAQMKGKINSWAIRFDYNMWKHNMINILPVESKANNIGHDGSGTHANIDLSSNDIFYCKIKRNDYMLENVELRNDVVKEFRKIFSCDLWSLFKSYISNL